MLLTQLRIEDWLHTTNKHKIAHVSMMKSLLVTTKSLPSTRRQTAACCAPCGQEEAVAVAVLVVEGVAGSVVRLAGAAVAAQGGAVESRKRGGDESGDAGQDQGAEAATLTSSSLSLSLSLSLYQLFTISSHSLHDASFLQS